jgi:hypothetical protein
MARRQRDPYYHRGDPGPWSKVWKVLAVALGMAAILAIGWSLTLLQPKRIKWDDPGLAPTGDIPAQYSALLDQSMLLEKQFNQAEQMREITDDDLLNLRQAIALQREYLFRTHNHNLADGNTRIDQMTANLQTYEAKPLRAQSLDLESQGQELENSSDYDGAKKLYDQAAKLEDKIMRDDVKGNLYETAQQRSIALHHRVEYLTALPLNQDSQAAEVAAKAAVESKDWPRAMENFKRARDLQAKLNQAFSDMSFTNSGRLESLSREVMALRSLPQYEVIQKLLTQARASDTAGDSLKAAQFYQQAEQQQSELINQFPDSRFADPAEVEAIEVERQTSLSHPLATEILAQAASEFADLRNRQIQSAQDTIAVLEQKVAQFHETYPRSTLIGDELQKRIDYLNYKRADFGTIQDQVYSLLLVVPGQQRFQLAKEEVSQTLYKLIEGGDPSRNPGPTLPVDSVSWLDAKEFCQRLSWILSRPVRLPTVEEFHAALGSTDSLDVAASTWNQDNSGGQTQAVATKAANANGFYDLLGNVAEWLERPMGMDVDVAPVIGGNVQTGADAVRAAPMASLAVDSHNSYTGFRFVVNSDDTIPLMPDPPAKPTDTSTPTPMPTP